jgi:hypothetical protein
LSGDDAYNKHKIFVFGMGGEIGDNKKKKMRIFESEVTK